MSATRDQLLDRQSHAEGWSLPRGHFLDIFSALLLCVSCSGTGSGQVTAHNDRPDLFSQPRSQKETPAKNAQLAANPEPKKTSTDKTFVDRPHDDFQKEIQPLLKKYCIDCHGDQKTEADVNFAALNDGIAARKVRRLWRKCIAQIENAEMPPVEAKQLSLVDRTKLMRWLKKTLESTDPTNRDPGPALVRRLSRSEYNRTMRDLLGIDFDAGEAVGIADESQGSGFSNQVGVLQLSPALFEKYFTAADNILDHILVQTTDAKSKPLASDAAGAVPSKPKQPVKLRSRPDPATPPAKKTSFSVQYKCAAANANENQLRPHFQITNASNVSLSLSELSLRYWFTSDGATEFQEWCDYAKVDAKNVTQTVRKLAQPLQDADAYIEIGFNAGTLSASSMTGEIQIRIAAHDWMQFEQPNDYSFDAEQIDFADSSRITLYRDGKLAWGKEPGPATASTRRTGAQSKPVALDVKSQVKLALERQKMLAVRDAIFIAKPSDTVSEKEAARLIAEAFARKAWRRPVSAAEIDSLMTIYDRAASGGADFASVVRPMLKAVLVSPCFLLRMEQDQPAHVAQAYHRVTDYELAVRLSYFIWSSMPDQELSLLAEQGKLSDPFELEKQTRRLLADQKAQALTDNFSVPWTKLGDLATARPTAEFFPSFTQSLKEAMRAETILFIDNLRQEDRSLLDLIDADYTYLNEELARHYGMTGVNGPEMRKVSLQPEDHRGGLLGMGSILASTSHVFRTSPTLRGKYVLAVLLGTPPPPPPANVGVLKDEARGKQPKTFRESLAKHASDRACAACHSRIDPLGFGLENYDGVGAWRDGNAFNIDAMGELPTGEKFSGPKELKKILLDRQDLFLRNVSEQMLAYALGRPVEDCDEPAVLAIQSSLIKGDKKFSSLVLAVVKSFPFQHRRSDR